MFDRTDLDLRAANHEARVTGVNRDGWRLPQPVTEDTRARAIGRAFEGMRLRLGACLVRTGERLQAAAVVLPDQTGAGLRSPKGPAR